MPNTQSPPSTKTPIAAGVEAIPQGAIAPAPDLPTDHPDGDILGQPEEFQAVKPTRNPRIDVLKTLGARVAEDEDHATGLFLDESGDHPKAVRAAGDPAPLERPGGGDEETPATLEVVDEPEPKTPAQEQQPPAGAEQTVRLNVMGREVDVPVQEVITAGVRTLQMGDAAAMKLREASALLDEAQRLRDANARPAGRQDQGAPSVDDTDARQVADALIRGDREETTRAIADLIDRGFNQQSVENTVTRLVAQRVEDTLAHREAVRQLHEAIPELPQDPLLQRVAATEERFIRFRDAQNRVPPRPYAEVYAEVARNLTALRGGRQPTQSASADTSQSTLATRLAAKQATPSPIAGAAAVPRQTTVQRPPTGQQIVQRMMAQRGGGRGQRI